MKRFLVLFIIPPSYIKLSPEVMYKNKIYLCIYKIYSLSITFLLVHKSEFFHILYKELRIVYMYKKKRDYWFPSGLMQRLIISECTIAYELKAPQKWSSPKGKGKESNTQEKPAERWKGNCRPSCWRKKERGRLMNNARGWKPAETIAGRRPIPEITSSDFPRN